MDNGYYKFYRSKGKLFMFLIPITIVSWILILLSESILGITNPDFINKIVLPALIILYLFLFFILTKKVIVDITPAYIKIANFEKLYWVDIDRIERMEKVINNRVAVFYNLWPKSIDKYKLTPIQKENSEQGRSPFCLGPTLFLADNDLKQIVAILKEYFPNSNIN